MKFKLTTECLLSITKTNLSENSLGLINKLTKQNLINFFIMPIHINIYLSLLNLVLMTFFSSSGVLVLFILEFLLSRLIFSDEPNSSI